MKLVRDQRTLKDVTQLIEYAFQKKRPIIDDSLFLSRYAHADCYGIYQESQLTSLVMANHFKVKVFQETVKMAGIGYVASYPESRGQGGIQSIMKELLEDLHEQGVVVSQLAPFSERFYRKFGYEATSWKKEYRIPVSAFDFFTSERTGRIERGTWTETKQVIKAIHQELIKKNQVGTVEREDWWWERLNEYYPHRFYAVIYDEKDQETGYLIYRMDGERLLIDELAYKNMAALKRAMTFLKAHASSFKEFIYAAPMSERIEYLFAEQETLSISIRPYMMSRIIDIQQLLSTFPFKQKVLIEVTEDEECPWNQGTWMIQDHMCKKVEEEAELKASIQTWSELLLGALTVDEALFTGALIKNEQCSDSKNVMIPKGKQSFYDYF